MAHTGTGQGPDVSIVVSEAHHTILVECADDGRLAGWI